MQTHTHTDTQSRADVALHGRPLFRADHLDFLANSAVTETEVPPGRKQLPATAAHAPPCFVTCLDRELGNVP